MSRRTGRASMFAALAVVAIAVAGCGGSSSSTTPSGTGAGTTSGATTAGSAASGTGQAGQELQAAAAQISTAQQAVKANPNDSQAWSQLAVASRNGADKLNALTLPSAVTAAKQRYAATIKTLGDDAAKIAQDLKNQDASATQAAKVQYLKDALGSATAAVSLAQAAKAAGVQ